MKITITVACLVASLIALLGAGQFTVPIARINPGASSPSIAFVQDVACNNAATHAAYACALTATGSNQYAVIVSQDYNAQAAAPTDSASDTFSNLYSAPSVHGAGTMTVWGGKISSGVTSITLNTPTSGSSDSVVRIYSGISTATQPDVSSASLLNTSAVATTSTPTLGTQNDLAVGACMAPSATPVFSASLDNWTNGLISPNASIGNEVFAADILNGVASQFTSNYAITSPNNQECAVVLLKGANAGSVPGGNSPTGYADFEASTDGTALSTAILNAGSHGVLPGWWSDPGSSTYAGFTVCSAGQMGTNTQTNVNGVSFIAGEGTRGICYNMATSPTNSFQFSLPVATAQVSIAVKIKVGTDVTDQQDLLTVEGGGSDHAQIDINLATGKLGLECQSSTSDSTITPTANTEYGFYLQYVAGGTHTLKIYTTPTTSPTLAATVTCAATGTNDVTAIELGQQHATAGTGTVQFDNLLVDTKTGGALSQ